MQAVLTFDDIITPMSQTEFLNNIYQKETLHLAGRAVRYNNLFDWETLADIFEQRWIDYPRLRLIRSGELLPPIRYIEYKQARRGAMNSRVNVDVVEKELTNGAMLHLASVEEFCPEIRAIANAVQLVLGGQVFVNAHAGLRASEGFDVHWDGHEVFVLQVLGRKAWKVYGVTDPAPLAIMPELKKGAPREASWEGVLEAGDLLYMPRGVWHAARALPDECTIHLTIGITNPTGIDFLMSLRETLSGSEIMRRDIPASSDTFSFQTYAAEISRIVSRHITEDAIRSYQKRFDLENRRSARLHLPKDGVMS
jgi:hypothetical protein